MNYIKNKLIITTTAVFLLIVGVSLGVWQFTENGQSLSDLPAASEMAVSGNSEQSATSSSSSASTSSKSGPPEYEKQFSTQESQGGPSRFVSKEYDFTFQYPENFSVSAFDDRGGHVVLVQAEDGKTAVQMFISSWDEPTNAVTPERIRQDLPNLSIREPKKMRMAGDRNALTFIGESEQFGTTREVWFARRGNLYQIITPAGGQNFLADLLETWRFQ